MIGKVKYMIFCDTVVPDNDQLTNIRKLLLVIERQVHRVSLWSDLRLAYGLLPMKTFLERRGISANEWLDRAGIARFGLMDPSYTISIEQELAFLQQLPRFLPAPASSLQLAGAYRLRGFSVLGLAMQASASPLAMLQLITRFPRLAWGMFDGTLCVDAHWVTIEFEANSRLGSAQGFLIERDFACALVVIEEALGFKLPVASVCFRHRCPGELHRYQDFFGCPVQFEADRNQIRSRREDMLQALPHSDPTICAFYSAQCERMVSDMDRPFRYSEAVHARLLGSSTMPSLETLAATMLLTPRTLQRRLQAEGGSYSDLLRAAREQRASELLADPALGLEQVAARLGYQDAVAFSHAFARWHGVAPGRWRQLRAD